jgi:hypothetical protein
MKTTTRICDRCRAVLVAQGSILDMTGGVLARQFPEPLDLCSVCSAIFVEFIQTNQDSTHGAIPGPFARLPGQPAGSI